MKPPSTGPRMLARLNVPVKKPMYFPRSAGENMSPSVAKTEAKIMPPPSPCAKRNAMKAPMEGAAPQAADAIMNIITPPIRKNLRPKRSPSFPTRGIAIVDVSM